MNTKIPHIKKIIIAAASALLPFIMPITSSANVLMINFGTTAIPGEETTNSPYHTTNGAFTDSSWNTVGVTDVASGDLLYSNGSTATGISLTTGASSASPVLNFSINPGTSNTLGDGGGVAGTTFALTTFNSAIWNGTNGTDTAVGVRIDGLGAGLYEVYAWGYFTNTNTANEDLGNAAKFFYAASGGNAASYDISLIDAMTETSVNAPGSRAVLGWVDGTHYSSIMVSVGAGESLYIAGGDSAEFSDDQTRGILSGIQVVAVPEPMTYSLFLGLMGLCVIAFRRCKK